MLRPSHSHILNKFGLGTIGVEIGIDAGDYSDIVLKLLSPSKYYMIDPYVRYGDMSRSQEHYNGMYESVCKRFSGVSNVNIIRLKSEHATYLIRETLDFVYLDGDHEYPAVKSDLELYYPMLKDGGVLCGHDYREKNSPDDWMGVKEAVDEFANKNKLNLVIQEDSNSHICDWWIDKSYERVINVT